MTTPDTEAVPGPLAADADPVVVTATAAGSGTGEDRASGAAEADAARHLVLVDGSGFIFRAFHALPPMTRADGTPVNAVFGFCNMLARLLRDHVGTHLAVIFDAGRVTFRNTIDPDYKAHRPDPPPELIPQFGLIRDATAAFGVPAIELDGFEADDLIATYAEAVTADGIGRCTIVSSDKDLMQLVGPRIGMLDPIKQKPIGADEVMEKYGVSPSLMVEVQALMGDPVDNVPGVPGVGPKKAAALISEYGTVEAVLDAAAAGRMKAGKQRELLVEHADAARRSRILVELRRDTPLPLPIEALAAADPEPERLGAWLGAMGFRSIRQRLGLEGGAATDLAPGTGAGASADAPPPPAPSAHPYGPYETVTEAARLTAWIAEAHAAGVVAIGLETDGADPLRARLFGVSLATGAGRACYVPLRHQATLEAPIPVQLTEAELAPKLRPLLNAPGVLKVFHNAKTAMLVLGRLGRTGPATVPSEEQGLSARADSDVSPAAQDPGTAPAADPMAAMRADEGAAPVTAPDPGSAPDPRSAPEATRAAAAPAGDANAGLVTGPDGGAGPLDAETLATAVHEPVAVAPVDDTMLISYAQDAGRHGHALDELAARHLGHTPTPLDQVTGTGRNRLAFDRAPLDRAASYAAEQADVTLRLWLALRPLLRPHRALALYERMERRLTPILAAMERAGITVDAPELRRISAELGTRMAEMERAIHGLAGRAFNLGSPKQLGEVLFDELGLPGGRRMKTGAWGTDSTVLQQLSEGGHELPGRILEWRQLDKLKSTYADSLVNDIHPDTGRVHTSFQMAVTSTGRLSSNDPNLQNIPIRTEEGGRIRRAFVAAPGHLLVSADYSQIELRLLAHVAAIPALRESFANGEDIHARTASEVFGVPMAGMDGATRRRAKAINFGIIYGISAFGLARNLGIDGGTARAYIDAYFARYPQIRDYMERTREEARIHGYVLTPFGRRCWIPGIAEKSGPRRGYAERQAINAPLQGGAADIIKRAMVRLPAALRDAGLRARMLLQVHDELLFEAPEEEAAPLAALARTIMESAATLSVPLLVETGSGRSWGAAH